MKLKDKYKELIIVLIILIIQTIVFAIAGINKSYIHMDEAYSLGLASYNKIEIQENENFYNTWHNKEYYEDYLTVNENERNNFLQVYENQKNDVHPPLYYLLLRLAMGFHIGSYSKWPGIVLNIVIYLFITIFMYLIIKKLLIKDDKCIKKSAILALLSSITLSSINNAIYIRMYALSTLNVVITTYLHLRLLDKNKSNVKLLFAIGIFALAGSLTHYYYLFYLLAIAIMVITKFIKEKEYKKLIQYVSTMLIAGSISLIIFPYSIQHIFFGYRGQGAISNLLNISKFITNIVLYILVINVYAFNNILFILLIIIIIIIIYKKFKKIKLVETKNKYIKYIIFPTVCYFILVAISSPWIELRYMMPICNLVFMLVLYCIIVLLKNITTEKIVNNIIIAISLLMLVMPFISNKIINLVIGEKFRSEKEIEYASKQEIVENLKNESNIPIDVFSKFSDASIENILLFMKDFNIEPEVLYKNKHEITEMLTNKLNNVPAIYLFNSNNNRFLDDILLFATIKESYIAKDIEYTKEKIDEILLNKDISNGVLIFINDGQENEKIVSIIKQATDLERTVYLKRLNACDVYYIGN